MIEHLISEAVGAITLSGPNAVSGGNLFWSTWLGLCVSFSLMICYGINVLHPGIDDCFSDRVYYSCLALVAALAFAVGLDPIRQYPQNITQTILVMLAIRAPWRLCVRLYRFWRTKQPQATLTQFKKVRGQSNVKTR